MIDGSFIAFGSILGPLFYGIFPPSDTSIVCGLTTVLGLAMSFVSGMLIQRKQLFRTMMRFSCFGTAIILISGAYVFTTQLNDVIVVQTLMIGVVIVPIIPVGINFSAELTFPIEPTVVTGTLMMVGQLAGFFLAILGGPLCGISKGYALGLFAVCGVIASICSIVI